jgi:hypothetical protein
MKGYFRSNLDHPSKIQQSKPLLPYSVDENRGGGGVAPWSKELGIDGPRSSGSTYGALIFDPILPTRPRWHKESVLLTCGGEIGPQRAGDDGATQAGFDGDEVLSQ